jgi:hypothetical protein
MAFVIALVTTGGISTIFMGAAPPPLIPGGPPPMVGPSGGDARSALKGPYEEGRAVAPSLGELSDWRKL